MTPEPAFIDVTRNTAYAYDPLIHLPQLVIIAVREHAKRVTQGRLPAGNIITLPMSMHLLAPKAFVSFVLPTNANDVPLPKVSVKSAMLSRQVQVFKPALRTPVVHPVHVYTAVVALRVRRHLLRENLTLGGSTKDSLDELLRRARDYNIEETLSDESVKTQLVSLLAANPGNTPITEPPTITINPGLLNTYLETRATHERELTYLPANCLDADAWLADWFDMLTPVFPETQEWLTKALMWRDLSCQMRDS